MNVVSEDIFFCDICDRIFFKKRVLLKHCRDVHNSRVDKPVYECNECQHQCSKKIDLIRHVKTHRVNQGDFYCDVCEKIFVKRYLLLKHRRKVHNIRVAKPSYECNECQYQCSKKKDFIRHIKTHEPPTSRRKRLICPECNENMKSYADLRKHITNVHNIELLAEKFTFENEEDFKKWKSNVEEHQLSSYVLNCGGKRLLDGSILRYYVCHRSYEIRSKVINERKRRSKCSGSNKIGKACPAGFSMKKCVDGKIVVKACRTHVGHSNNLQDVFLSKEDRQLIARKLQEGVEVGEILNEIRNSAATGQLKRIHLLERKDILNIKQNLGAFARRYEDDSIIEIHEYKNESEESILQETIEFISVENDDDEDDEEERNKERIQALLENMLGLIAVQNLDEEQYKLLERKLRTCHTIINGDKNESIRNKFKIEDNIDDQKNVSPQKIFVSCEKPQETYEFPQVSAVKSAKIKKCFPGSEGLDLNCSSSILDHMY